MSKSALAQQQPTLEDAPAQVPAIRSESEHLVLMFERLAKDPAVDVVKLEKLIEMQERIIRHNARAEFYAAFAEMQGQLPSISERGEIVVQGQVRSTYARDEDITEAVRPILKEYGFALSFRNEFTDAGKLRIIGVLSHRGGHTEQDQFICEADTSGSKNAIQALGSSRSYGKRYTTISLLNISTRGTDDDGATSEQHKAPDAPAGYDDWLTDLAACADEGLPKLTDTWNRSKKDYRDHLIKTNRGQWESLKKKAAMAGKVAR